MNNIDLTYAEQKGIAVKNVKGYSTQSVVQHTFSMLFYLLNHTKFYDSYVKEGRYAESNFFAHLDKPFSELEGLNVGIIGLGTIGKRVAQVAEAFGAVVSYFSTSGKNLQQAYTHKPLETLLAESDVVSIHAPLNDKTLNLINYERLSSMKPTAVLINTGRGKIVNETDLAQALNENKIAAAALDVLEFEPIKKSNPLLQLHQPDKILITPHIAWAGASARQKLLSGIYKNIVEYIEQ